MPPNVNKKHRAPCGRDTDNRPRSYDLAIVSCAESLISLFVSRDEVIAVLTAVCQGLFSVQYAVLKSDHHFIQLAEQRHQLRNAELFRVNADWAAGDTVVACPLIRLSDKIHLEGGRVLRLFFGGVPLGVLDDTLFVLRLALVGVQIGFGKVPLDMVKRAAHHFLHGLRGNILPACHIRRDEGDFAVDREGSEASAAFGDEALDREGYTPTEQTRVVAMNEATPSYAQTVRFRRLHSEGKLTADTIEDIMAKPKANQRETVKFSYERIARFFPPNYSTKQMEDAIVRILEERKREVPHRRDDTERG